jgi:hypothetical protein
MLIAAKIVRVDPAGRLPVIAHSQRVTSDRMDMAVFLYHEPRRCSAIARQR